VTSPICWTPGDPALFGTMPELLTTTEWSIPQKVKQAAEELIAARPGLATGARVPTPSFRQRRRTPVDGSGDADWGTALRGE
jgi:hypothetical protein